MNYDVILDKVQCKIDKEVVVHKQLEDESEVGSYQHGYHVGVINGMFKVMTWISMLEKGRRVVSKEEFEKWCDSFENKDEQFQ